MARSVCQWFIVLLTASCIQASAADSVTSRSLHGETLVDMGRRYNHPLLMLVGKALSGVEYSDHHPHRACAHWTAWSACDVYVGVYGMATRERQCSNDTAQPTGVSTVATTTTAWPTSNAMQTESRVCRVVRCPTGYELAVDGICLMLRKSRYQRHTGASYCAGRGGHLMAIDSQRKFDSFIALVKRQSWRGGVWVDGWRNSTSSPWQYDNAPRNISYTNWARGQPVNCSDCFCRYMHATGTPSNLVGIYSIPCYQRFYVACEASTLD